MLLFINLENRNNINLYVIGNEKIVFSRNCNGYKELIKKINRAAENYKIDKYTIVKYDTNITVLLNSIFEFKKDLKMIFNDIQEVGKAIKTKTEFIKKPVIIL